MRRLARPYAGAGLVAGHPRRDRRDRPPVRRPGADGRELVRVRRRVAPGLRVLRHHLQRRWSVARGPQAGQCGRLVHGRHRSCTRARGLHGAAVTSSALADGPAALGIAQAGRLAECPLRDDRQLHADRPGTDLPDRSGAHRVLGSAGPARRDRRCRDRRRPVPPPSRTAPTLRGDRESVRGRSRPPIDTRDAVVGDPRRIHIPDRPAPWTFDRVALSDVGSRRTAAAEVVRPRAPGLGRRRSRRRLWARC